MSENYFLETQWLHERLGRFTASEIHKLFVGSKVKGELFGQVAKTYIRTKVAEILTQEVKQDVDFKQAEWGKANEVDAMREFEKYMNVKGKYYGAGDPVFFPFGDWAGGSPDWESEDQSEGADFKCPYNSSEHVKNTLFKSAEDLEKERWEYYCQGQMNMIIRSWKKFHFVSYDPRMVEPKFRIKVITIYKDEAWEKEFNERLKFAIEEANNMLGQFNPNLAMVA